MGAVWRQSKQKGSALLLLLSLADYADERGVAFPSVETLANKVRMSERNVQLLLRKLEVDGEVIIEANAGPGGANRYRLTLQGGEKFSPHKRGKKGEKIAPGGGEIQREGGEIQRAKGVKPASPDPSLDPSIDPSLERERQAASPPPSQATETTCVDVALDGESVTEKPEPGTVKAITQQPAIQAYRGVFLSYPSKPLMVQILNHGIDDLPRWSQAVTAWCKRGYNPLNIGGMLEWYDNPDRMPATARPAASTQNGTRASTKVGRSMQAVDEVMAMIERGETI